MWGFQQRLSERIMLFIIREFRSCHINFDRRGHPHCCLMRACDLGRVFFGSVSLARAKEMNSP
jgi:hypothetical protein